MIAHLLCKDYKQMCSDKHLYTKRQGKYLLIMAVTIDAFNVATSSDLMYIRLLGHLIENYTVKNLGDAIRVNGLYINRDKQDGAIHISQSQLKQTFINFMRMKNALEAKTTYLSVLKLNSHITEENTQ